MANKHEIRKLMNQRELQILKEAKAILDDIAWWQSTDQLIDGQDYDSTLPFTFVDPDSGAYNLEMAIAILERGN